MGSYVEINDTLQITKEQGFPKELDWKQHHIRQNNLKIKYLNLKANLILGTIKCHK